MSKRISPYAKVARLKEFLEYLVLKYKPQCPFCGQVVTAEDCMHGHEADDLTIHHMDQDRSHNQIENLILSHRGCHRSYHLQLKKAAAQKELLDAALMGKEHLAAVMDKHIVGALEDFNSTLEPPAVLVVNKESPPENCSSKQDNQEASNGNASVGSS